ncbi:hypothetical protein ACFWGD_10620 [Corynebacterium sp. NPDC060344]|uniref:hypothetical protein n=1 Tax=Corynebacterium sp. NPDC060344 TaxID=3347101 RepID=UPI00364994E3
MKSIKYTTLRFGRVELASDSLGTKLRVIQHESPRRWSVPGSSTDVPIDEGRRHWTREEKVALSGLALERAADVLDAEYPGGHAQATADLLEWLLAEGPS